MPQTTRSQTGTTVDVTGFELCPRPCPACSGEQAQQLWRNEATTSTRSGVFAFDVRVAVCLSCGCAFVTPAPSQHALNAFYADSHAAFEGAAPDYSPGARLEFLDRLAPGGGRFVEIGANTPGPFRDGLAERFSEISTVEPNGDCDSDADSIEELPAGAADVVAHYFVLEHVVDTREFLDACRQALRPGGLMVCEVPDLHLYPTDAAALLLHEHVNHFSIASLAHAASRSGFRLVDVSHRLCSRSFGFVAAFEAVEAPDPISVRPGTELAQSRSCIEAGAARIERYWASIDEMQRRIADAGGTVVVWAANDVMTALVERGGRGLSSEAVLVDSDPSRARLPGGRTVLLPEEARDALRSAELLVICTPHHAEAIRKQARGLAGRALPDVVIGSLADPRAAG